MSPGVPFGGTISRWLSGGTETSDSVDEDETDRTLFGPPDDP